MDTSVRNDDWMARGRKYTSEELFRVRREARVLREELRELKAQRRDTMRSEDQIWFDHDRKLWFSHNCLGTTVDAPLDGWKLTKKGGVSPSVLCQRCGAHFEVQIQVSLHYIEPGFKPWSRYEPIFPKQRGENKWDRPRVF